MKFQLSTSIAILTLTLVSAGAHAGEWVKGYGESIREAIETAKDLAEFRISQRGSGCVDGKTRNLKKETIDGEGVWTIEIFTNDHNGSCGIDVNAEWIRKETSKYLDKL